MLHSKAIQEKLSLDSLPLDALLALRIAFDDPLDIVDLDQDIADLKYFPERLDSSYQQEWRAFIVRAIAKLCSKHHSQSEQRILVKIRKRVDDAQVQQQQRFQLLLQQVKRAQGINGSEGVVPFPHHLRQQLNDLLDL